MALPALSSAAAPAREQERLAPVFTAIVREVLDAAFERAAATGRPLDPPLLVVLDEAASVAPLADLDRVVATAAGHGVQLVTVWQDLAQVESRYGGRWATVVNNHRAKLVCSGITDPVTLQHVSGLLGDEERAEHSWTVGNDGRHSRTEAVTVRALAPPGWLRQLPPGEAVLVYGSFPPARIALRPFFDDRELASRAQQLGSVTPGRAAHGRIILERRWSRLRLDRSYPARDSSRQIDSVVTQTLVEATHQSQFDCHADGCVGGDELRDESHMEVVHLVVQGHEVCGRAQRVAPVAIRRDVPHRASDFSHALDVAPQPGGHLGSKIPRGAPGDVLGQITASLQLWEHSEHGQQVLSLRWVRRAIEQARLYGGFELLVKGIDVGVCGDEDAGSLAVGADQCVCRPRDGVLHESKQLDHVTVDQREVNRLASLASHRAQDPVRPFLLLTGKTVGREHGFRGR